MRFIEEISSSRNVIERHRRLTEVGRIARVSDVFHRYALHPSTWRTLYLRDLSEVIVPPGCNWLKAYHDFIMTLEWFRTVDVFRESFTIFYDSEYQRSCIFGWMECSWPLEAKMQLTVDAANSIFSDALDMATFWWWNIWWHLASIILTMHFSECPAGTTIFRSSLYWLNWEQPISIESVIGPYKIEIGRF